MIATAIDAAPTATMTARGEQSRTRKRMDCLLSSYSQVSPLESWVARLPKFMPLRSYGEVGGLRRVLRFEPGYSKLKIVGLEAVGGSWPTCWSGLRAVVSLEPADCELALWPVPAAAPSPQIRVEVWSVITVQV